MKNVAAALLLIAGLAMITGPALAANMGNGPAPDNPHLVAPSNMTVPLPAVQAPASAQAAIFPALPPSRTCNAKELHGLWKLVHVYEDPQASETSVFRANPNQYLLFRANSVYGRLNTGTTPMGTQEAYQQILHHSTNLLQYVVQDTGVIYYYQDRVATESQACFIVANARGPFPVGHMLLMPPKGQIQGRLVKEYRKLDLFPKRPKPHAFNHSLRPPPKKYVRQTRRR